MRKSTFKTVKLAAALLVCAMAAAGCSSKTAENGGSTAAPSANASTDAAGVAAAYEAAETEPFSIEMVIGYDRVEFPQPGNAAQTKIEEYTNTKLNITAYPGSTLHEMLPTMIASDELPMVISFGGSQLSKTYMINAMKQGIFWV